MPRGIATMYRSRYNGNRGHNAAKTKNKKNGNCLAWLDAYQV